jgi:hypothetical protein
MGKKFGLTDFGRLVKPKILLSAFLMFKHETFDPDSWWREVKKLNRASKNYKRDTIHGTYGHSLIELFGELDVDNYIAQVDSFLVFHYGNYKLVKNLEQLGNIRTGHRMTIVAVGVKIYKSYDHSTKEVGEPWGPTNEEHISWFFTPKQLVPLELVVQYESANVGDLVLYRKSHGMVYQIKVLKRNHFYSTCSWTRKKVMVLSAQDANPTKLSVDRPYKLLKDSV